MKRTIGIMLSFYVLLVAVPAHALTEDQCFITLNGDYYLAFDLSTFSGKEIDDGYVSFSFSDVGRIFTLCGFLNPDETSTTDSFFGEAYDSSAGLAYLKSEGAIIWNSKGAYLQGGYNNGITSSYIDGTIKCSRGKCSLTAKGGINDYSTFIVSYSSIRGSGIPVVKGK